MKLQILTLAAIFLFSGCALKEQSPPLSHFTIQTPSVEKRTRQTDLVLKVRMPKSPKYISQPDILYTYQEPKLLSYAYNQWQDVPNEMIHKLLANVISDSGLYKTAILSTSRIRADLALECRIEEFIQTFQSPSKSQVNVSLRLHLLNESTKELIVSQKFVYSQPTQSADASGAVQAYNQIFSRFSDDVLTWLERHTPSQL